MQHIDEKTELVNVSPDKIVIKPGVPWSKSLVCRIGCGGTAVSSIRGMCVQLHFIKNGVLRDIAFFENKPPLEPLRGIGMDVATLLGCENDATGKRRREFVNLVANHVYTPLAGIEIAQQRRQIKIFLAIGSWRGSHRVASAAFKASLGL